jgi:hypothetical protein
MNMISPQLYEMSPSVHFHRCDHAMAFAGGANQPSPLPVSPAMPLKSLRVFRRPVPADGFPGYEPGNPSPEYSPGAGKRHFCFFV